MFEYLKDIEDGVLQSLFDSSLSIFATIFIQGTKVSSSVDQSEASEDSRYDKYARYTYPLDLHKSYRIKVWPTETFGLRLETGKQFDYSGVGIDKPWDLWISCLYKDVRIRENNTLFDFANSVQTYGNTYLIRGVVFERLGTENKVVHVFLGKNTDV